MDHETQQSGHGWLLEESQPTHFDHDAIDRLLVEDGDIEAGEELREAWESEAKCSAGGEILLRLVDLLLPSTINQASAQSVGIKVMALAWMMQSSKGSVGSMPLAQIAKRLSVSRALLSHWVRYYEKTLGFHARGQKMRGAVDSYREASGRGWATRRERIAAEDEADLAGVAD